MVKKRGAVARSVIAFVRLVWLIYLKVGLALVRRWVGFWSLGWLAAGDGIGGRRARSRQKLSLPVLLSNKNRLGRAGLQASRRLNLVSRRCLQPWRKKRPSVQRLSPARPMRKPPSATSSLNPR